MSLYQLVYGKTCPLLVELEHKAFQVIKSLNLDEDKALDHRLFQLNQFDKFKLIAQDNALTYNEKNEKMT